ncbi:hypothetical protein E5347_06245 [Clostridium sartagoforme]|uniref:Protein kinase domain-containing protein n=1 Tax=Clostridium sartagoforme TaxID=84031 RepID=A0A4S2DPS4_9CLOT|nr:hypothetical protein [Clostridium sartagoforme]TGY44409.1 hypothetical protein E5347_06245 [Clostridium sartagoforme]
MFNMRQWNYRYIGSGSSRNVFDLGNGYVIKVAKNIAGIAQNMSEYRISSFDSSDLFAEVIEVSEYFNTLIMRKADKIRDFRYILDYFKVGSYEELFRLREFQNIQYKYNLLFSDLSRMSSWGIINGRPTIIDYGFTREVVEKYYRIG